MSPHFLHSVARRSERVAMDASVSLRRPGQLNYRVRIFDSSLHGCRVEFVERPSLEEQLWVKFDGLQPIEAEVCWIDGFMVGQISPSRSIRPCSIAWSAFAEPTAGRTSAAPMKRPPVSNGRCPGESGRW